MSLEDQALSRLCYPHHHPSSPQLPPHHQSNFHPGRLSALSNAPTHCASPPVFSSGRESQPAAPSCPVWLSSAAFGRPGIESHSSCAPHTQLTAAAWLQLSWSSRSETIVDTPSWFSRSALYCLLGRTRSSCCHIWDLEFPFWEDLQTTSQV